MVVNLRIPPPIQGFFWALCMWGLSKAFPALNWTFPMQTLLGLTCMAAGLSLDLVSMAAFFKARTTINPLHLQKTSHLVTSGLFRLSRNPMYLGMALMLIGWAVILGNPINLIMIAGFIFGMNTLQIEPEEDVLSQLF